MAGNELDYATANLNSNRRKATLRTTLDDRFRIAIRLATPLRCWKDELPGRDGARGQRGILGCESGEGRGRVLDVQGSSN